ncbi:MAG: FAD-binding oxidoreductase [Gammaproteobacteria bacterium]|nr:FAD-binding oxidoreductase [Gammaproteobacteria bacterium]
MFDPLLSREIKSGQNHNAYWLNTTDILSFPTIENSAQFDVVIVGGGYTGLSCAIHLAKQGVKNIAVLESNHIGFGCSGRNAGFVLPGSGRLGYGELVKRFGKQGALSLHQDYLAGIDLLQELSSAAGSDIERTESGYLKLAHSAKWFDKLKTSADYLQKEFDYDVEIIEQSNFCQHYVDHKKVFGAIRYSNGFGLNPLKLVNGYANYAKSLGVAIFQNASVTDINYGNDPAVTCNGHKISADKIVMATNGYTPQKMPSPLQNKILPVLTSVIVTEPLTKEQLANSNFRSQQVMMDTRELKYYYRLLPDKRVLFGGRSAITGKQSTHPKYKMRLLTELQQSFPALASVNISCDWTGWISVALDQMPHIYHDNNVYYSTGYCGGGVSFTSIAGKKLADLVVGKSIETPLATALPNFPFPAFRRLGQTAFYQWGRLKDSFT